MFAAFLRHRQARLTNQSQAFQRLRRVLFRMERFPGRVFEGELATPPPPKDAQETIEGFKTQTADYRSAFPGRGRKNTSKGVQLGESTRSEISTHKKMETVTGFLMKPERSDEDIKGELK